MIVRLTATEVRAAATVAVDQTIGACANGRAVRYGGPHPGWTEHVVGVLGETVVAKALDRYPHQSATPDYTGDVGRLEVRATERDDGRLIVHRDDDDDGVFVLVRGIPPAFELPGWLYGREAKREEWWSTETGRPAFFAPADQLHPFDELPDP